MLSYEQRDEVKLNGPEDSEELVPMVPLGKTRAELDVCPSAGG